MSLSYAYSFDEECFTDAKVSSPLEALNVAREAYLEEYVDPPVAGVKVWIGRKASVSVPHIRQADAFLEEMAEAMGDKVGDIGECWPEAGSREDENLLDLMLNVAFQQWLAITGNRPTFWIVEDVV